LTLPGMTADYARRIVGARPFRSFADIERAGIPRAALEKMVPPAVIDFGIGLPKSGPRSNVPASGGRAPGPAPAGPGRRGGDSR
jgi:hypothetical protein